MMYIMMNIMMNDVHNVNIMMYLLFILLSKKTIQV